MKKAAVCGTSDNLYRLLRNTVPWRPGVSEVNKEFDDTLILSEDRQRQHWRNTLRIRLVGLQGQ